MVRTKVFVGNLSFSTTEAELAKEFEVAGKVVSANIITRGPRSLGYGFVEMDNEGDANNAVKLLDKKEIGGRPINVEVAKDRVETTPNTNTNANAKNTGRNKRPSNKPNTTGAPQSGAPSNNSGAPQSGSSRPSGQRERKERNTQGHSDNQAKEEPRTLSTDTLFVANLPFALTDEGLAKMMNDCTLSFSKANVAMKRSGRSKGFGFITFANQEDQKKALDALNNKDVDGRPLSVKVAHNRVETTGAPSTSSPAPVKTSSPAPVKTSSPAPTKTSSPAPSKSTSSPSVPKAQQGGNN